MYDRDIKDIFVIDDKLHVEYMCQTEEGIFTKDDLDYLSIFLSSHRTFHTNECTSSDDLAKLIKQRNWEKWIVLQIEEEGFEQYKKWYARMLQRGAICDELIEAHNKLFNGEMN